MLCRLHGNGQLKRAPLLHLPWAEVPCCCGPCVTVEGSRVEASKAALPKDAVASTVSGLQQEKAALKRAMRQWERDYEERNGGLVPTHYDKKDDPAYRAITHFLTCVAHTLHVVLGIHACC